MLKRLWAAALACLVASAAAADPPPSSAPPYRSGVSLQPVSIYDAAGNIISALGGGSGGGSSTVTGSMEQDVRATGTLNAATANAAITTAINGQATVGYAFTGLTGTGATLTYEQSIDGGTTWTGINAVNRGTGVPEATRTTDGQIALSATGRTAIRVRVSTTGTGTITVATNVSVREGIMSLGSPLPPGGNEIGFAAPMPSAAISVQRTTGIGTTGTLVSAADTANRRTVTNTSSIACEIMGTAAAYGTGYPLPAGGSFTFDAAGRTTAAIYVACASAGGTVAVLSY